MSNVANNARFKGTEHNLETTLISLAGEKSVADITVMELCQAAGINRSTFYAHYDNITAMGHSLLSSKFEEVNATFASQLKKATAPALKKSFNENVSLLLKVLKENKKLCLAFLVINRELEIYDKSFDLIMKSLGKGKLSTKTAEDKYKTAILKFTFYTVLTTYLKNNCKDKDDFVAGILAKQLG